MHVQKPIGDKRGVFSLPMRMVVSIIIGGSTLGMVIYYLSVQCFFPENLQVNWEPTVISEGNQTVKVMVRDSNGNPVKNAVVTIIGLETAFSNKTGDEGKTQLKINPVLHYRNEGYLGIKVRVSGCYRKFTQEEAIKVVKA